MTICASAIASLMFASLRAADARDDALAAVLSKTATYLMQYEPQLTTVVAEEHYEQKSTRWLIPTSPMTVRRVLDSDFLFLRLPGNNAWLGLRDTFRADGQDVRPAATNLFRDLQTGDRAKIAEAIRIVTENARRNLGDVSRTVNVPTTALDFFTAKNQPRFRFSKSGEERVRGRRLWTVHFDETSRPTLVTTAEGADERSRGTAWIDPSTGAIERTILDLGDDSPAEGFVRSRITVVFDENQALGFLVPVDMVESYYRPPSRDYEPIQIVAHATYTQFRRFQVSAKILPP